MSNLTFTMIKPEAVEAGNTGAILNKIESSGFRIVAMKKVALSKERAGEFYEVHKERPFYSELVDYMSSGPIIAAILEKDNAVAHSAMCTLVIQWRAQNADELYQVKVFNLNLEVMLHVLCLHDLQFLFFNHFRLVTIMSLIHWT